MSYPAKAIANYFIHKAIKEGDNSLTLMKLLKLLYISQGWCLAILNKPLFDEEIQAWKYGPVIPSIYQELKHHSLKPINSVIEEFSFDEIGRVKINRFEARYSKEIRDLLDRIWETHRQVTGIQLSNWSHDPDGPWYGARKKHHGNLSFNNVCIPNEKIKAYFIRQGSKNGRNEPRKNNT